MALQIVILWAAVFSGPRYLERFVIRAEFDCEIGLHATSREQAPELPAASH
jgi:hypothetical protein